MAILATFGNQPVARMVVEMSPARFLALVCAILYVFSVHSIGIGRHRRILRSIASRLKQEKQLDVLSCNQLTDAFLANVKELISSKELVQIKVKVDKKKEAKVLGDRMALATDSMVAQVVGHTVLLYRMASPPGLVTQNATRIAAESSDSDEGDSEDDSEE